MTTGYPGGTFKPRSPITRLGSLAYY
ncbi:S-layer homology domain-containing protein [Anaerobacillus sp. HL2]|nr:S-layer homology domain-containing protein [Anaerobacillus sp. HL2]